MNLCVAFISYIGACIPVCSVLWLKPLTRSGYKASQMVSAGFINLGTQSCLVPRPRLLGGFGLYLGLHQKSIAYSWAFSVLSSCIQGFPVLQPQMALLWLVMENSPKKLMMPKDWLNVTRLSSLRWGLAMPGTRLVNVTWIMLNFFHLTVWILYQAI